MEPMTPEERLIKIENLLRMGADYTARHEERLDRLDAQIEKQTQEIDKHNAAIRDLIAVSRTLLDSHGEIVQSQKRASAQIEELVIKIRELRDAQQNTDQKLHILIETVDRVIRNQK
jgi:hypothetical protein